MPDLPTGVWKDMLQYYKGEVSRLTEALNERKRDGVAFEADNQAEGRILVVTNLRKWYSARLELRDQHQSFRFLAVIEPVDIISAANFVWFKGNAWAKRKTGPLAGVDVQEIKYLTDDNQCDDCARKVEAAARSTILG